MSLLNYLQYFAERKDKARERELQDSANQWLSGYDGAKTPEERQQALAGINTAVPDITVAAKLQDFIFKRDQALTEYKQRQGINQTFEELSKGKQTGGPLREGFEPLGFQDYTMPESLKMFIKYGPAGVEQFDKFAGASQTAGDAKRLADFRTATASQPYSRESVTALRQQFPTLVKQYDYGADLPEVESPYDGLSQDYETFLRANQIGNSPQAYRAFQRDVIAQKRAGATTINNHVGANTPGRKKVDEDFGTEYTQFIAAGGYADVAKQVSQLREVVSDLGSGKNLTGPFIGSMPDAVLKYTNPEAISAREQVEEVAQRNLRLVLGSQFTEKEGDRLIRRAFNPNLSEQENAKRVGRLLKQIEVAAQSKQSAADYFEANGTLTGWTGKRYNVSDFVDAIEGKPGAKQIPSVPYKQDQGGGNGGEKQDLQAAARRELERRRTK